ncbi:ABC transporter substrate-binding protein [Alicyclobacillus sp. SO9]|uniref:ABC transporter substrate-binding protein n=1 Tax=Alicyclobacillus sp. SO9 TaxID=2665646 RepID=UPI0018E7634D|nr:sugar ABC transporter substrate-binding protein [Alicyclobacillus sp. SO9]QQE79916.1 sugar ABC transporter substrate-binding protein [Alicyclobacillus sp. SO9]
MSKLKATLGFASLGVLTLGIVTGCGSNSNSSSTSNGAGASSSKPVSLTLGMWSSSPAEKAMVQKQVKGFEKKFPNIHVNIQVINGNYEQQIQTMLAAHTAPDVFYVNSSNAQLYESKGVLMPLEKYMQKDGIKKSDFSSSLLKAFEWKGTLYGIPKDFGTLGLYYNKALLSKAGISSAPTTWTQFQSDAAKLKAKGINPLAMDPSVGRYYPWILDEGGSYYDAKANKVTLTNPKNAAGLNFYLKNAKKKYIVQPKNLGQSNATAVFANKKAAMMVTGAWAVPSLKKLAPNMKYGIAKFPSLNGNDYNLAFTVSYSMSKHTKHPAASAKLLFYMTGDSAEKLEAVDGFAIPSRKSQQAIFSQQHPQEKAFVDGVSNSVSFAFGLHGSNVISAVDNQLPGALDNKETASQMLKKAQSIVQSQQG